jgi:hypothetical protein
MISYDAEVYVSRQKEMARRAAESYPRVSHQANGAHPIHRRALARIGGALVTLGYRLQGEIDQLSAAPELAGSMGLSHSEPCLDC